MTNKENAYTNLENWTQQSADRANEGINALRKKITALILELEGQQEVNA